MKINCKDQSLLRQIKLLLMTHSTYEMIFGTFTKFCTLNFSLLFGPSSSNYQTMKKFFRLNSYVYNNPCSYELEYISAILNKLNIGILI